MFSHCPRCDHAPLPQDQALPAACPACGVILAKVGQPVARRPRGRHALEAEPDATGLAAALWRVPDRVDTLGWRLRLLLWAGFAAWGLALMAADVRTGEIASTFLHMPLLVFHEAGHVLLRPLGEWLTVAGGTLLQLLMPALVAATLLRRGDPFGASFGLWLLGVSLMDTAAYVYDAQAPQLTLLSGAVGGESHDFIWLLSRLDLLHRAQVLGLLVHALGAVLLLLAMGWGGALLWRQRERLGAD